LIASYSSRFDSASLAFQLFRYNFLKLTPKGVSPQPSFSNTAQAARTTRNFTLQELGAHDYDRPTFRGDWLGILGPKIARNLDALPHAMVADMEASRFASLGMHQLWIQTTTQAEEVFRSDVDAVVIATPAPGV